MDLGLTNFFWDTLDMSRRHWNGLQAGTLEHPCLAIDTTSLLSIMEQLGMGHFTPPSPNTPPAPVKSTPVLQRMSFK